MSFSHSKLFRSELSSSGFSDSDLSRSDLSRSEPISIVSRKPNGASKSAPEFCSEKQLQTLENSSLDAPQENLSVSELSYFSKPKPLSCSLFVGDYETYARLEEHKKLEVTLEKKREEDRYYKHGLLMFDPEAVRSPFKEVVEPTRIVGVKLGKI
jgi:hypothetical protein